MLSQFFPDCIFQSLGRRHNSKVELVSLTPHHVWRPLNSEGVVHPTDERIRASTAELRFQLKLTNIAVKFFGFRLDASNIYSTVCDVHICYWSLGFDNVRLYGGNWLNPRTSRHATWCGDYRRSRVPNPLNASEKTRVPLMLMTK